MRLGKKCLFCMDARTIATALDVELDSLRELRCLISHELALLKCEEAFMCGMREQHNKRQKLNRPCDSVHTNPTSNLNSNLNVNSNLNSNLNLNSTSNGVEKGQTENLTAGEENSALLKFVHRGLAHLNENGGQMSDSDSGSDSDVGNDSDFEGCENECMTKSKKRWRGGYVLKAEIEKFSRCVEDLLKDREKVFGEFSEFVSMDRILPFGVAESDMQTGGASLSRNDIGEVAECGNGTVNGTNDRTNAGMNSGTVGGMNSGVVGGTISGTNGGTISGTNNRLHQNGVDNSVLDEFPDVSGCHNGSTVSGVQGSTISRTHVGCHSRPQVRRSLRLSMLPPRNTPSMTTSVHQNATKTVKNANRVNINGGTPKAPTGGSNRANSVSVCDADQAGNSKGGVHKEEEMDEGNLEDEKLLDEVHALLDDIDYLAEEVDKKEKSRTQGT